MCHLRPNENIAEEVKDILKPEEVKALVASTHRPNYCMQARHRTACTDANASDGMHRTAWFDSGFCTCCTACIRSSILMHTRLSGLLYSSC
jgi:hypothetical protein